MGNSNDFSPKVIEAIAAKAQWYDETVIPKILETYRLLHTCTKNLYDLLIKKSVIKEDPYRLDKEISGLQQIDNNQFAETDRHTIIGLRLSDYETMLDWVCTYYKFSVDNFSISSIKKFIDFNNSFQWSSLSENSSQPNTRGLAGIVSEVRNTMDAFTIGTLGDILSKCKKCTTDLADLFKDLADFEKECYKYKIRKDVFMSPKFDEDKAFNSPNEEMAQIKRAFPSVFGKEPFYTQLVEEIIKEDQGADKEKLRDALLKKLEVRQEQPKKKKAKTIDTKEILMTAVQSLYAFATPLETIHSKLNENNKLIKEAANKGIAKLFDVLRKALNLEEKPIIYDVTIIEPGTNAQKKKKIDFYPFCADIKKRVSYYNAFATKSSPGYKKFSEIIPTKVLEFLNKQISDIQNISITLKALDTYFKNSTVPEIRSKIRGLSMELTTLKNCILNTNQYIADYTANVEEQEQMKRLGISE